jgi:Uma2 family endonuclease
MGKTPHPTPYHHRKTFCRKPELRPRTDSLSQLQAKIQEYLDSGLRLGWLIDPISQQVAIYRQNQASMFSDCYFSILLVRVPTTSIPRV